MVTVFQLYLENQKQRVQQNDMKFLSLTRKEAVVKLQPSKME